MARIANFVEKKEEKVLGEDVRDNNTVASMKYITPSHLSVL